MYQFIKSYNEILIEASNSKVDNMKHLKIKDFDDHISKYLENKVNWTKDHPDLKDEELFIWIKNDITEFKVSYNDLSILTPDIMKEAINRFKYLLGIKDWLKFDIRHENWVDKNYTRIYPFKFKK